ncbi:MAG: sterol desaturase family protein [Bacteroidota bacterium]
MHTYGSILLVAMPAFLVLVLLEKAYGWFRYGERMRINDVVGSLSSGITNVTKDVLGLSVAIISYGWMVSHLAVVQVPGGWQTYVVAFIALDFAGYWVHRIAHTFNLFWNNHIVHHSGEEFDLACALRQSISQIVRTFAIFLLPAALLGVPQQVIVVVGPIHLFAQFWYHTRMIGRMGILEHIIVTPSHHRVHHAINPEYLDRNFGQIFIIWDKLFGTFQEEKQEVPCVYGVTRPVRTWNPFRINFMHLWLLIKDAWRTKNLVDKFRIWFMPLGWRPEDVAERFPVYKIGDVNTYEKYDSGNPPSHLAWISVQFLVTTVLVLYLFGNIAQIGSPGLFWYGGFIFLSIFAYTEFLDRRSGAIWWEFLRAAVGLFLLFRTTDWFGAGGIHPVIPSVLLVYFVLSAIVTLVLVMRTSERGTAEASK